MLLLKELHDMNMARLNEIEQTEPEWAAEKWADEIRDAAMSLHNVAPGIEALSPEAQAKCLADIIIFADILAGVLGIDLEDAVKNEFNAVSEVRSVSQRL